MNNEYEHRNDPPQLPPGAFSVGLEGPVQNIEHLSRRTPLLRNDPGRDGGSQTPGSSKLPDIKDGIQSFWIWEALSLSTGLILFGIYLFLLVRYDGQLVPKWEADNANISRLFRTLQSAVSFLTTLMKGAMVFPVASAIGQLKWHYMRRPTQAKTLEVVDGASRGYWGAVRLLLSRNCWSSASLGAVIMIGTIFLGPFLQNTVQQSTQLVELPSGGAAEVLLPAANGVVTNGRSVTGDEGAPSMGMAMFSSIMAGWADGASSVDMMSSRLPTTCDYEYCEWTDFTSLAVSTRCRQANAAIARGPVSGISYGLSREANVANLAEIRNATGASVGALARLTMRANTTVPAASGFANTTSRLPLIAHFGILGYYNGSYQAAECLVYWAAQHFQYFAANGTTQTWSTPTEYNTTATDLTNATAPVRILGVDTCRFNGTDAPCHFEVSPTYHLGLQGLLIPFLTDTNGLMTPGTFNEFISNRALDFSLIKTEMFYGDWIDRLDRRVLSGNASLANQTSRFMQSMAHFMTNNIRSNSHRFVFGVAGSSGPYFAIRRHYAVYPAAFLGASILFVAATAWRTRREPIWKNSALALLYHGFEKRAESEGERVDTMASMERAAALRVVRLADHHDGLGAKLRDGG